MPLPQAVSENLQPVSEEAAPASAPDQGAEIRKVAGYFHFHREQPQWCWAAVALSALKTLSPASTFIPSQCKFATDVLESQFGPTPSLCPPRPTLLDADESNGNVPMPLQDALGLVGCLRGHPVQGSIDHDRVVAEIDNQRPVGVRIEWGGGAGHFVTIYGYKKDASGQRFVYVSDSKFAALGATAEDFDTFTTSYQGQGFWNWTYHLKPPS